MSGAISPLPQYASTAWCSIKAQGQLYFLHHINIHMLLTLHHSNYTRFIFLICITRAVVIA